MQKKIINYIIGLLIVILTFLSSCKDVFKIQVPNNRMPGK